jgi:EAL domain-containing protein (putative c-di-GMP-specific phosphodiesterase class I)
MTTLAISIGSHVIAEGVETAEEYRALKEIGVHYGQGYLFGRPAEALEPVNKDFLTAPSAAP